jgi:1-acyl-sn-glycerol-3-phosphate acyltransferase
MNYLIYYWALSCTKALGIKVQVENMNLDELPAGALILSNHQSNLDIPFLMVAFQGRMRMLAKAELQWVPLFGQAMLLGGMIAVSRKSSASRQRALRKMKNNLKEGISIWMAPEGTRSRESPKLSPFKRGAFQMAWEENFPIQPFVIFDAYKAMAPGGFGVRMNSTIHAKKLPLIESPKTTFATHKDLLEFVKSEMERTLADGIRH